MPNTKKPSNKQGIPEVVDFEQLDTADQVLVGLGVDDFEQLTHAEHVLLRPGMYVGSVERKMKATYMFDVLNRRMIENYTDFPDAPVHLFKEILDNAMDNSLRSREHGVDPGRIDVSMTRSYISVKNTGLPLPVLKKDGVYIPTMVLGALLSGSNYGNNTSGTAGQNGLGATVTNLFSKYFNVKIYDSIRHKHFKQTWTNNMSTVGDPTVENYSGTESSTTITYLLDFERFGLIQPVEDPDDHPDNDKDEGYPFSQYPLFSRLACDASLTAKIPVSFNGETFEYFNLLEYSKLYFKPDLDNDSVIVTEDPKYLYFTDGDAEFLPTVEMLVIDTPNNGMDIAFANFTRNLNGGSHIDSLYKIIVENTIKDINDKTLAQIAKYKKGDLSRSEKSATLLKAGDLKDHLSVFLNVRVKDPKFDSQTKTKLTSPASIAINIDPKSVKKMLEWDVIKCLENTLIARQSNVASKSDGKSTRYIKLDKETDANFAGVPSKSGDCILFLTEGLSASSTAMKIADRDTLGHDYIGVMPMRGKVLNVRKAQEQKAGIFKFENNKEICVLKKMLGLREGVNYSDPLMRAKLRYGKIILMCDQDNDGTHIASLIVNLFDCKYDDLLAEGFVSYYRTPIITVKHGKELKKFYRQYEYDDWAAVTSNSAKWTHRYFKGLGTQTDMEIADYWNDRLVVVFNYDQNATESLNLAFSSKRANDRKTWIENWDPKYRCGLELNYNISDYINHELVQFSIEDLKRSIPGPDGFKDVNRKIIAGSHRKWNIGGSTEKYSPMKVAQLGPHVAASMNYHHGESSITDAIRKMAQEFTGANNVALFEPEGQFGTRYLGGKDASAPRYIFTNPSAIMQYIFRKEDLPILEYNYDEGDKIEPVAYQPIIPYVLVNGAIGIATGWSTFIPCYSTPDLIEWIRSKLANKAAPLMLPYYEGFKGKIETRRRLTKTVEEVTRLNEDGIVEIAHIKEEYIDIDSDSDIRPILSAKEVNAAILVDLPADLDDQTITEGIYESDNDDNAGDNAGDNADDSEVELSDSAILRIHEQIKSNTTMVTIGSFYIDPKTKTTHITELPIGVQPFQYYLWIQKLREKKKITGFRNDCKANSVHFELYGWRGKPTFRNLKLMRKFGIGNMIALDKNSKPVRYNSHTEILEAFYDDRLNAYTLRKKHIIKSIKEEIKMMNDKSMIVEAIVSGELKVLKVMKADVNKQMIKLKLNTKMLDTIKITNCTPDEHDALLQKIQQHKDNLEDVKNCTIVNMWLSDLNDLEKMYRTTMSKRRKKEAEIDKLFKVDAKPKGKSKRN